MEPKFNPGPMPQFLFFSPHGMYVADLPGARERFKQMADLASKTDLKAGPAIRAMGKGFKEWALQSVPGEVLQIGPLKTSIVRLADIELPIKGLIPMQPDSVVDEPKPGRGLIVEG